MTAREILDPGQLALLLQLADLAPHEASPLPPGQPVDLANTGAERLRARGLLLDGGAGARVNTVFREVLAAAAQPEEVLSLRVTGPGAPGFAFCRRGRVWTEVSSSVAGVTHFAYPLSRRAMIVAAGGALSGTRAESAPVGFHFRGPSADGLLLNVLVRAGGAGLSSGGVAAAVREHVERHAGSAIAAALYDPAGVRALLDGSVDGALVRLRADGHVQEQDGRLIASRRARAVLGIPAEAGFTASRTTVEGTGIRTTAIQVWRCGDHSLVSRPVTLSDGSLGVDWSDRQKADIRALLAAVYSLGAA